MTTLLDPPRTHSGAARVDPPVRPVSFAWAAGRWWWHSVEQ
ncbi:MULTISPECIES: hypothetical protein [unclassified Kribbella]